MAKEFIATKFGIGQKVVENTLTKEEIRQERRAEILQLARDTAELCELSNEINTLIGESTPILLDIEKDTEVALENVQRGSKNVTKAVEIKQAATTKKIIIIGALTTIGLASGGGLGAIAGTYLVGKALIGGIIGMASLGSVFGTSSILITK